MPFYCYLFFSLEAFLLFLLSETALQAGIDPSGLADFLYKMGLQSENTYNITWIQSHPDSKERAQKITEYVKGKMVKSETLITNSTWNALKNAVHQLSEKE